MGSICFITIPASSNLDHISNMLSFLLLEPSRASLCSE